MNSLIPCPTCGKEISSDAVACPQCGHPLRPTFSHVQNTPSGAQVATSVASAISLIIGIAVLSYGLWGFCNQHKGSDDAQAKIHTREAVQGGYYAPGEEQAVTDAGAAQDADIVNQSTCYIAVGLTLCVPFVLVMLGNRNRD